MPVSLVRTGMEPVALVDVLFAITRLLTPSYNDPDKSIAEQIRQGMEFHRTRYRKATNTWHISRHIQIPMLTWKP